MNGIRLSVWTTRDKPRAARAAALLCDKAERRLLPFVLPCTVICLWQSAIGIATAIGAAVEIDFGCIEAGAKVTREAKIVNDGQKPLSVKRVSVSCGCVAAASVPKVLAPGKEAKFDVRLSAGAAGTIRQDILIEAEADGGAKRNYRIEVVAVVSGAWVEKNAEVDFGLVGRGQEVRREFVFFVAGDGSDAMPRFGSANAPVEVKVISKTQEKLKNVVVTAYRCEAILDERAHGKGEISGEIAIQVGATFDAQIPVKGRYRGKCLCRPETLFFGRLDPGKSTKRVVKVTSAEKGVSLDKLEVSATSDFITIKKNLTDRQSVTLEITYTAPAANVEAVGKGLINGAAAGEPLFEIPFLAVKKK